jgi:ABC-type oligopeptide transport system substrate-binding subunit
MKSTRKLVAILTILALLFSVGSMLAFAAGPDTDTVEQEEEVTAYVTSYPFTFYPTPYFTNWEVSGATMVKFTGTMTVNGLTTNYSQQTSGIIPGLYGMIVTYNGIVYDTNSLPVSVSGSVQLT